MEILSPNLIYILELIKKKDNIFKCGSNENNLSLYSRSKSKRKTEWARVIDNTAGRELALYVTDPGLIPTTLYGPLGPAKNDT